MSKLVVYSITYTQFKSFYSLQIVIDIDLYSLHLTCNAQFIFSKALISGIL